MVRIGKRAPVRGDDLLSDLDQLGLVLYGL